MSSPRIQSLSNIDWLSLCGRSYTASPPSWEDQFLYFLMLDRFSDGNEDGYLGNDGAKVSGKTPLFTLADAGKAPFEAWSKAGSVWRGGTLKGAASKIGYLARMGVTAVWISPVFKQRGEDGSYHGYGIQDFLDIDPHFGTAEDLKALVDAAHAHGIYVILDIIINHAGDVFGYSGGKVPNWSGNVYPVAGFRNAFGEPVLPFAEGAVAWANDGVWPRELQNPATFHKRGRISNWDFYPEFADGDFEALKDIDHGYHPNGDPENFIATPALKAMFDAFRYWIAYADVDGYRIDTVKHMELGAARAFATAIHEFAQSLGKERFFLVGEITGGRGFAFERLEATGLDAALGIDELPDKLEYVPKGWRNPADYFNTFRNSKVVGKATHKWFGGHVVTMIDDHDQVRKGGNKARFCGQPEYPDAFRHLPAAIAMNMLTMGVPCLYYGTEQGFDGRGPSDRYLRECMFGGEFGSLQSTGRHFFDENHPTYRFVAELSKVRKRFIALRRGRQYLRPISDSGDPGTFGEPTMVGTEIRSLVPWSRLFANDEVVCAINTDAHNSRRAWVTVDAEINAENSEFECVFSTDPAQIGSTAPVAARNGRAIDLRVPPAGVVVYVHREALRS